ncbi:MAG: hypothetical protein WC821_02365 [archaeon]|jgi:hypothetical protein
MKLTLKGIILLAILMFTMTVLAATPEITQVTYTPNPALPGSIITVLVQVENLDSTAQKGVTLQIENQYPFTVKTDDAMPNPVTIGNIGAYGKALTQFNVYVDPTAENKTYYLPITSSTSDNLTGKKTNFAIVVNGKEPILKVVMTSSDKLLPGQEKEIEYTIQNVGTSPAYDVILEMKEDRTVTATGAVVERDITPLGAATAYVATINPMEQKIATLKVSVTNTATIKNYTLPIQVSYRNASGTRTTDISYVGLKVFGTAELDATLKEVTGIVAAGQKPEITIEIFNKGLGKAEFTVVELKTEGTIQKPKQFIGALGPNDVDTVKTPIVFNTSGDQVVEVTISYQDSDSIMKTKTISIPIKATEATAEGPNMLLILVVIAVVGLVVWNFFLKGKGKK